MISLINVLAFLFTLAFWQSALSNTPDNPRDSGQSVLRIPLLTEKLEAEFNPFDSSFEDLVRGTMFEPLVAFNTLTGEIHYRLANRFYYGQALKSLTYELKSGLTWSDGHPLTAKDVVFSFELAKKYEQIDKGGLWGDKTLKKVVAINDHTVKFLFNQTNTTADWMIANYYIVPKHIWSNVKNPMTFQNPNPVGSGPITEVDFASEKSIKLCKNPNFYRSNEPHIDCIEYKAYKDNNAVQDGLINGEIDWAAHFIANIDKNFVAKDPEHYGYWYPPEGLINLYFNTKIKPFNELNFRKAVSMALDRDTIVDLAAYGYPTAENHVVGIGLFHRLHFNDNINAKFDHLADYDPQTARELLDEIGYIDINGDGFRELPNGNPLSFSITVHAGWTEWEQAVQMTCEYLSDIGIEAKPKAVHWNEYDKDLKTGNYEMMMNWSLNGIDPIVTYKDYFHTSRIGKSWQAGHGTYSKKINKLIDNYSRTQDGEKREKILNQLMTFTAEKLPFIPLWSNPTWFQYNSTHIVGWPTEQNPYVQPWFFDANNKLLLFTELRPRSAEN